MAGIVQFVDTFLRVVLALGFLMFPGLVFWLVVSGLLFTVTRITGGNLFGTLRKGVGSVAGQPSLLS